MSDHEGPAKTANTEQAVRKVLRRYARDFSKVLLTRNCHRVIEQQIESLIFTLQFLKREARRKVRSKEYTQYCKDLLATAAAGHIGPLASLPPEQLGTLEKLMNAMVRGFAGKPPEKMEATDFLSLQKKIFQNGKRGPKFLSKYHKAYLLSLKGETVTRIARKLDPEKFQIDPVNTLQKYWRAIERRKRQAFRQ
jgi:hypothetical protein